MEDEKYLEKFVKDYLKVFQNEREKGINFQHLYFHYTKMLEQRSRELKFVIIYPMSEDKFRKEVEGMKFTFKSKEGEK